MSQTSLPLLVTGAAGFIGSRFVVSCQARGIPVISVDRESHFADRTEHRGIAYGTIVDRGNLFEWLEREKPALRGIVHLGACANTMETDEAFFRKWNVEYSQKLWQLATRERLPLVYASSAATYGEGEQGYDDDESALGRLRPLNPYGRSKHAFDLWALEQERAGHAPPAWSGFKFFNVYGPGERHKNKMASVVLHAFDQIQAKGEVRLFRSHRAGIADGHQARDFVFVDDVVSVLEFALARPLRRGIFNLGSGQARTYLDLTRAVFRSLDKPEKITFVDTPIEIRDKYQYFTQARMARLRAEGYAPPFTALETGVEAYVHELLSRQ
ncbi:MAG: ADP-glyceromanno-heptose 6-epimerase [Oligoflexia bacterium]|nr:ADP-glyceromanno-heptose 6-epimerase [Oligoflexia bacterium]